MSTVPDECYQLAQLYLQDREDMLEGDIWELAIVIETTMQDWLGRYDRENDEEED